MLGYWGSPNNPDGSFGSYSVAATRGYQKENGISVTGRMNKATLTHIEKSTGVLYAGHKTTPSVSYISKGLDYAKLNDTGAAITTITTKLKNLGFLTASKSTFDSTVRTAVGNFQSQYVHVLSVENDSSTGSPYLKEVLTLLDGYSDVDTPLDACLFVNSVYRIPNPQYNESANSVKYLSAFTSGGGIVDVQGRALQGLKVNIISSNKTIYAIIKFENSKWTSTIYEG